MEIKKNQIIYGGFILHILAAIFSIGYHQCDELFQVFEFAGYKLGINPAQDLPWEFHSQMRSGIEPLWVYSITLILKSLTVTNPFHIALFLRLTQALVTFVIIVKLLAVFEEEFVSQKAKLAMWAFGLLFWCLPYFHTRLSSENFSTALFMAGLLLVLKSIKSGKYNITFLSAGYLFGIAFVCRFQTAFMLGGLFAWLFFIKRVPVLKMMILLSGLLLAIFSGVLVDKWLYGNWTLTWWNYLYQNVFEDKASVFGRSPFYFYVTEAILQLIPPFSLIIIFSLFGFWIKFRHHVLTWVSLPFIVLHFFVAHKELRFLFPMLNFLPVTTLLYFQSLNGLQNKLLHFIRGRAFLKFAVTCNILLLLYFTFKPADETSNLLKQIYKHVDEQNAVLYYEANDPYNNQAGLNYFKKPNITKVNITSDTLLISKVHKKYFFLEKFDGAEVLVKNGITFKKIYANYPAWFNYINFNGWLNRAPGFSIYKETSEIKQ